MINLFISLIVVTKVIQYSKGIIVVNYSIYSQLSFLFKLKSKY